MRNHLIFLCVLCQNVPSEQLGCAPKSADRMNTVLGPLGDLDVPGEESHTMDVKADAQGPDGPSNGHVHENDNDSVPDNEHSPMSTSTPISAHSDHDNAAADEVIDSGAVPRSEHPNNEEGLQNIESLPQKPTKAMRSLINLSAVRVPQLREGKRQDLAIRPVNHEAALAQSRGQEALAPCDHCNRQRGIWVGCVVVPGYFRGACANCHYMGQGTRCSLRPGRLNQSSQAMADTRI